MRNRTMRNRRPSLIVLCAACLMAFAVQAQQVAPGQKLEPLLDVPPPRMAIDPALEPQITIRERSGDKIEEFRIRGRLYMIRVTPPGGTPYVLLDQKGDGQFSSPTQGPADAHNVSVPMWVIGTF